MSEAADQADSTTIQYNSFCNTFAQVTKKSNRHWKNSCPPKKFLTDENIRKFLAHYWTFNYNQKTVQCAKSYVSWALKQCRLPGFIKEHEHNYLAYGSATLRQSPRFFLIKMAVRVLGMFALVKSFSDF